MAEEFRKETLDEFVAEHAKRNRRISQQQSREWAEGLLRCLPDSIPYRIACTPHARLKEQALLNQLVADWKRAHHPE